MTKPRDYQDGPKDVMVETPAGRMRLHLNNASAMYLDANHHSGDDRPDSLFLAVRGVEYGASAHLILVRKDVVGATGEVLVKAGWRVSPASYVVGEEKRANWNHRQGLYARRRRSSAIDAVSAAARRTLIDIFEEAANRWAESEEAPELLRQAEVACLSNSNRSDEEKLVELEQQVAVLRNAVRLRDVGIAKFKGKAR